MPVEWTWIARAKVHDRDGAWLLAKAIRHFGPVLPRLIHVWADAGYAGPFKDELDEQIAGKWRSSHVPTTSRSRDN